MASGACLWLTLTCEVKYFKGKQTGNLMESLIGTWKEQL